MNDMAPPNAAARLSEDIGDVLSAIRRLIAEDEALTAARDLRAHVSAAATLIEQADPLPLAVGGDVLAQRHGGNSALARQIVGRRPTAVAKMRDPGRSADIQAAAMRAALAAPAIDLDDGADDEWIIAVDSPPRAAATEASFAELPAAAEPMMAATSAARLGGAFGSADARPPMPAPRSQIIVPSRADVTPAAPPLRLGAAQRVVPTGDDAAASGRLHMPWRPWAPAPARPIGAPPTPMRLDPPAEVPRGRDGSRLSPVALARSLADAADQDAQQDAPIPQSDSDLRAPIRRHDMIASAAPAQPAPPPAIDFDTMMAAMRAVDDDAGDGWPTGRGEIGADEAAEDAAAVQAEVEIPAGHDAEPSASDEGAAAASQPAAKAPIVTGLDIDLMDENEADLLIRKTIRAMIQEELHGELGERFSRNLRAVIRREIASAIDEQIDRF